MKELLESLAKASLKQTDMLDQLLAYARAQEEREIRRYEEREIERKKDEERREERKIERKKEEERREEREMRRDEEREIERKKDEERREEREMRRDEEREIERKKDEERREERKIERKKDEERREERESQRDEENAKRWNDVHKIFQSIVSSINGQSPLQPTTSSSPISASGNTGASSLSNSRQTSSPKNRSAITLRRAFAESESASKYDISGLMFPISVERLMDRGVLFAHRVACKGAIGESKDFDIVLEGMETILLPPNEGTTSRKGLSFFVPLSNSSIMLQASHDFQNAKNCLCYPLDKIPTGMTLTIDKIQVYDSTDESIAKIPIMLHACLSTNERIPVRDFMAAVDSWSGRQLCSISASADIIDNLQYHNTIDGLQNEFTNDDDDDDDDDIHDDDDDEICCDDTVSLLKRVALKLETTLFSAPSHGSPGS
jgi:hypothetical protein